MLTPEQLQLIRQRNDNRKLASRHFEQQEFGKALALWTEEVDSGIDEDVEKDVDVLLSEIEQLRALQVKTVDHWREVAEIEYSRAQQLEAENAKLKQKLSDNTHLDVEQVTRYYEAELVQLRKVIDELKGQVRGEEHF